MPKITPVDMQARKREGRKITMLSVYDYPLALLADRAGLDSILVGDSLAMTALGDPSTVPLTLDESLHHVKAVARAAKTAMVVAAMPFMSYQASERDAVLAAGRFLKEGMADAVKIDGLFIRNLPQDYDNQLFVKAIVSVAKGLNKTTIAECVEDEETLQMLKTFGVDAVQGYHLEKPRGDHPMIRTIRLEATRDLPLGAANEQRETHGFPP
jgi:hypothetical protein